jgi:hypothetical protein
VFHHNCEYITLKICSLCFVIGRCTDRLVIIIIIIIIINKIVVIQIIMDISRLDLCQRDPKLSSVSFSTKYDSNMLMLLVCHHP